LVKETICQPLNMNCTVLSLTPELKRNAALGHTDYGEPAMEWDLPLPGGGGLRSRACN